ncbi:hypothetical protein MVEG_06456 [Podila verticillata NRRL 6337]|nr:hypothetical protein MVEG_06456 [Podila verticillata NRRL 6337]
MEHLTDEELARKLQEEEYETIGANSLSHSRIFIDSTTDHNNYAAVLEDESTGPFKDLHGLFLAFNDQYFESKLSACEVRWSPRMTLCAGLCVYQASAQYCSIRLSEPLLKFRPESDYIDTLLHEMIHAYLFVTQAIQDHDGHGADFQYHMDRINKSAGTTITIFHTFHDEVRHYQTHVWKCDGPCQHRPPYFGIVRRSMNRPPQPADRWFEEHQATCGGTYTKISEPEPKKKPAAKKSAATTNAESPRPRTMLDDFLAGSLKSSTSRLPVPISSSKKASGDVKGVESSSTSTPGPKATQGDGVGNGQDRGRPSAKQAAAAAAFARLEKSLGTQGHASSESAIISKGNRDDAIVVIPDEEGSPSPRPQKRVKAEQGAMNISGSSTSDQPADQISTPPSHRLGRVSRPQSPGTSAAVAIMVECPVCGAKVAEATINDHVDLCIWRMNGGDK